LAFTYLLNWIEFPIPQSNETAYNFTISSAGSLTAAARRPVVIHSEPSMMSCIQDAALIPFFTNHSGDDHPDYGNKNGKFPSPRRARRYQKKMRIHSFSERLYNFSAAICQEKTFIELWSRNLLFPPISLSKIPPAQKQGLFPLAAKRAVFHAG
jgi:hypothetical protein